jgi:hypothetical protein
MKKRLTKP